MARFILICVLSICFCFSSASAVGSFLGVKRASEYISIPLIKPLDSSGCPGRPDSVHVITYADNASAKSFSTRSTTYPFSAVGIDTTKDYGDTAYWFVDQIQDIDGAGAHFQLAINVTMWYKKLPTTTIAAVQVVSDSLENFLDAGMDSSSSAAVLSKNNLDSIQNHDNWVAKEATVQIIDDTLDLYDTRSDSLLAAVADGNIGDKVWTDAGTRTITGTGTDAITATSVAASAVAEIASETSDSILQDSLSYQGAGADSTSMARWVWNTPQVNHTAAGTFGRYLDTEISGISSGSGIYSYTIQVYDTVLGQVISGVSLAVRNISQTSLIAAGATDSEGEVGFNLDADSFTIVAAAPGYVFTPYDTIVVTGAGVDTVFGYRFDPGAPVAPELCRVYGWVVDVGGEAEQSATVSACLPKGIARTGSRLVSPFLVSTRTDSLGYFYLDLIPSDSLTGDDTSYEIAISRQDGTILRNRFSVPALASWQLVW